MQLGERAGDKSKSRYCGLEMEFNNDMPHVLAFNLSHGSFDFAIAPLVWYEWCVASPSSSPIHNTNGRSYWVGL